MDLSTGASLREARMSTLVDLNRVKAQTNAKFTCGACAALHMAPKQTILSIYLLHLMHPFLPPPPTSQILSCSSFARFAYGFLAGHSSPAARCAQPGVSRQRQQVLVRTIPSTESMPQQLSSACPNPTTILRGYGQRLGGGIVPA